MCVCSRSCRAGGAVDGLGDPPTQGRCVRGEGEHGHIRADGHGVRSLEGWEIWRSTVGAR